MEFRQKRRQQFLVEPYYVKCLMDLDAGIQLFTASPAGSGDSEQEGWMISYRIIAAKKFDRLMLQYTAGAPIEPLREGLEEVVAAYERYGESLWKYRNDRDEFVFDFQSIDDYCQLIQLIGLCFLLHRRDLLARLAVLQDGEGGANGGADNLYEEFMAHGLGAETRYESDWISAAEPYQALSDALFSESNDKALQHLHRFLQTWYKDLVGTAWHDSHKPNEAGEQGGYYGYWSFEAGAAVLLLGIEDDSSLHQYMHYPKDMVAWARENASIAALSPTSQKEQDRLRCLGGRPCPQAGYWLTPAKVDSRRLFKQDEVMPDLDSDYGATIWQWDEQQ